jgi:hypothetical protein
MLLRPAQLAAALLLLLLDLSAAPAPSPLSLFVAPASSDTGVLLRAGDGLSRKTAFTSLTHARDAIRALPTEQRCRGVTVTILRGEYSVLEGGGQLQLDERDSGCTGRPVVWRGEGAPVLHAGVKIPASAFHPVTVSDFGEFTKVAQVGQCVMEQRSSVYYNKQPQTLARYPNLDRSNGNFRWMRVGQVSSWKSFASSIANDTLAAQRWMNDTTGDIWLHGFWSWVSAACMRLDSAARPPSSPYNSLSMVACRTLTSPTARICAVSPTGLGGLISAGCANPASHRWHWHQHLHCWDATSRV